MKEKCLESKRISSVCAHKDFYIQDHVFHVFILMSERPVYQPAVISAHITDRNMRLIVRGEKFKIVSIDFTETTQKQITQQTF